MKFKAKICHITTVHNPFDVRIFHKECKTIAKAGYKVCLIAQHNKDEVVNEVKIIALPKAKNRLHRIFILTLIALRYALKQRADIYHFHDPELLPVGVLLKLFTGKKIIYDVHENIRFQILNKYWLKKSIRKWISLVYHFIEKCCLFFIDFVILAEDSYLKYYDNLTNVRVVRNYPILKYVAGHSTNFSKEKTNRVSLIYVGCISKLRGVFETIEGIKILRENGYPDIQMKMVGTVFPESITLEIDSLLSSHNLMHNIKMVGGVPHDKIYGVISKSLIGVAILHPDPNYLESIPTKLFEYMAVGLPVIVSDFPVWKEIVERNKCGICVDPLNPRKLAEAVKSLTEHPEQMEKMSINGKKAVLDKYNWEKESDCLLSIYCNYSPRFSKI